MISPPFSPSRSACQQKVIEDGDQLPAIHDMAEMRAEQ